MTRPTDAELAQMLRLLADWLEFMKPSMNGQKVIAMGRAMAAELEAQS